MNHAKIPLEADMGDGKLGKAAVPDFSFHDPPGKGGYPKPCHDSLLDAGGVVVNAGNSFTGKKILQYSIILLGFEMNLFHVLDVGAQSLSVMVFTLLTAFAVAWGVGRFLQLEQSTTTLIGAGTAICGGGLHVAFGAVFGRDFVIANRHVPIFYRKSVDIYITKT